MSETFVSKKTNLGLEDDELNNYLERSKEMVEFIRSTRTQKSAQIVVWNDSVFKIFLFNEPHPLIFVIYSDGLSLCRCNSLEKEFIHFQEHLPLYQIHCTGIHFASGEDELMLYNEKKAQMCIYGLDEQEAVCLKIYFKINEVIITDAKDNITNRINYEKCKCPPEHEDINKLIEEFESILRNELK
jgi:hypothetical protein